MTSSSTASFSRASTAYRRATVRSCGPATHATFLTAVAIFVLAISGFVADVDAQAPSRAARRIVKTPAGPPRTTPVDAQSDSFAGTNGPASVMSTSFGEDFDNFSLLAGKGWFFKNNSTQLGTYDWAQGDGGIFAAQLGESSSYVYCTFLSGAGVSTVSNWMLTPEVTMINGDTFEFWTRTTLSTYADRLEVRLSTNGASTNVGSLDSDVGDFTTLVLSINPSMTTTDYPQTWTRYTGTISGLSGVTNGRIAFRYFVANSGAGGSFGDYVGIDSFRYYKQPLRYNTLNEGFDNVSNLISTGWYVRNNSSPLGNRTWLQGRTALFSSKTGVGADSYVSAGFESGAGTSTLSDWIVSPPIEIRNGDQIKFWTRTVDSPLYSDRLELRMSTNGYSTNVGSTATDVGDFTRLLVTVNPTLVAGSYPNSWTQYVYTVTGLPTVYTGRVAFRYFVTDGGPDGVNSDYIGIDDFQYFTQLPTAADARISGRVVDRNGMGVARATVRLTDGGGATRIARTSMSGYYEFTAVPSGASYVLSGSVKRGSLGSRVIEVTTDLADIDLTLDR